MNVRILLAESEAEDALFLQDVLTEIETGRHWNNWVHIETHHAATWDEASMILANEPIDLILLDPALIDPHGVTTHHRIRAAAEQVPMVLLLDSEDDAMGMRLVREGAQDFLCKKQIDCRPLAHAMRNAIERHRLVSAARAASSIDTLTGLPNRAGFLIWADRDRKLAERIGRRLMILVAEPHSLDEIALAFGEQRRDLTLVEAADHLRTLAGPTDLVGRIGANRFGIAVFETDLETLEEIWARIHAAGATHRIRIGAAVFTRDRPMSLDALLNQAAGDLAPNALAMRG